MERNPVSDIEDQFRWCVHCGADCYGDETAHADDCPSVTNVWPVTEQNLGIRGPDDPYAHGMLCTDCEAEFKLGDHYTHRLVGEGAMAPGMPECPIYEIVCLGCAAQEAVDNAA